MAAIETELRRVEYRGAERVNFVVRTTDPIYQRQLVKMGWRPTPAEGEFARLLDSAPEVESIFDRFSRHIEAMIRQSARLEATGSMAATSGGGYTGAVPWRCAGCPLRRAIWTSMSTTPTWPERSWLISWSSR